MLKICRRRKNFVVNKSCSVELPSATRFAEVDFDADFDQFSVGGAALAVDIKQAT